MLVYSASNYGTGGPGQIALHAHRALQRSELEHTFYQPHGKSDYDHDALVAASLLKEHGPGARPIAFHGFGNASLLSMYVLGAAFLHSRPYMVIERASTHPEWQWKALRAEEATVYPLLGRKPPTDHITGDAVLAYTRQVKELELADTIVVPSPHLVETFPEELRPRCRVIQFGADVERYQPAKQRPSEFRVLWLGALWLRKGLYWLERAFSEEFAGVKDARLVANADPRLRFPGVDYGNIEHAGYIPDRMMPQAYQRASVYVMPSIEEGQMISVWEALASGLPCILTWECGHRAINDAVAPRAGWLLNAPWTNGPWHALDPEARVKELRSALRYYYDNPSEVEKHGRSARVLAESRPWTAYEDELVKLWKEAGA